jgi:hypothetical protein
MSGFILTAHATDLCIGQSYDVGRYPDSIATGDFNGDGKLDLVTANSDFNNVSVLYGDGAGRFGAAKAFGVGTRPQGVAVADFDGDHRPDIVAVNNASHNVSVLLSNGPGFSPATNYTIEWSPQSVAVGDFNGDGKPDLAVTSSSTSSITILTGDGSGHFSNPTKVNIVGPSYVAVGDFNRDGKSDLVIGRASFGYISILLNNGLGGFGTATDIQIGINSKYVAVGDLNGDGRSDLAVLDSYSSPPKAVVLLDDGMGRFTAPTYYQVGNEPSTISIGDFDNDGKPDLAVANYGSNSVSILQGDGAGKFTTARSYEPGGASATAVGDFNADGRTDLAVSYSTVSAAGKVTVLFNSCNAVPALDPPPTPASTYSISGRVVNGVVGFTFVKLSGTQGGEAGLDSNGNYIFANLPSGGNYTVTPYSVSNVYQYTFSPSSQTFTKLGANQVTDFTQNLVTNSISGKVTDGSGIGLAGIDVVLNMGSAGKTLTDGNGNYSFPNVASGNSYQVAASSLNYMFTPFRYDITNLSGNAIANFTAIPLYNITGRVTDLSGAGMAGVFVTVNGPMSRSATTDSNGNYLLNSLPAGGDYTMNLSKANYAFDPPGRTFNNLSGHQTANFTGIPSFNITGHVTLPNGQGISGVSVALNGSYASGTPYAATITTYSDGYYSLSFLAAGGTYTVTPSKANYTFQPADKTFKNLSGDQTSDFSGILSPPHLVIDESGTEPNQATALDSLLFLRDPFPIVTPANWLNNFQDRNTRVIVFVTSFQLAQGEASSSVVVNIVDANGQSYDIAAEDVRLVPLFDFTQVRFRLPNNLSPGLCTIKVKAHGQESNSGTIRIRS